MTSFYDILRDRGNSMVPVNYPGTMDEGEYYAVPGQKSYAAMDRMHKWEDSQPTTYQAILEALAPLLEGAKLTTAPLRRAVDEMSGLELLDAPNLPMRLGAKAYLEPVVSWISDRFQQPVFQGAKAAGNAFAENTTKYRDQGYSEGPAMFGGALSSVDAGLKGALSGLTDIFGKNKIAGKDLTEGMSDNPIINALAGMGLDITAHPEMIAFGALGAKPTGRINSSGMSGLGAADAAPELMAQANRPVASTYQMGRSNAKNLTPVTQGDIPLALQEFMDILAGPKGTRLFDFLGERPVNIKTAETMTGDLMSPGSIAKSPVAQEIEALIPGFTGKTGAMRISQSPKTMTSRFVPNEADIPPGGGADWMLPDTGSVSAPVYQASPIDTLRFLQRMQDIARGQMSRGYGELNADFAARKGSANPLGLSEYPDKTGQPTYAAYQPKYRPALLENLNKVTADEASMSGRRGAMDRAENMRRREYWQDRQPKEDPRFTQSEYEFVQEEPTPPNYEQLTQDLKPAASMEPVDELMRLLKRRGYKTVPGELELQQQLNNAFPWLKYAAVPTGAGAVWYILDKLIGDASMSNQDRLSRHNQRLQEM